MGVMLQEVAILRPFVVKRCQNIWNYDKKICIFAL